MLRPFLCSKVEATDPVFDAMTSRPLQREALRRAAEELNPTSGPRLEDALARISAEVTAEASARIAGRTLACSISFIRTLRSKCGSNALGRHLRASDHSYG